MPNYQEIDSFDAGIGGGATPAEESFLDSLTAIVAEIDQIRESMADDQADIKRLRIESDERMSRISGMLNEMSRAHDAAVANSSR